MSLQPGRYYRWAVPILGFCGWQDSCWCIPFSSIPTPSQSMHSQIWSLDGRIVQILNRGLCNPMSFDPSAPEFDPPTRRNHKVCVRDVSWHSQEPVIMSVGWESGHGGSTVARHEWKGLSKMHNNLEDWAEKQRTERAERLHQTRTRHVPGAFTDDEDAEDTH